MKLKAWRLVLLIFGLLIVAGLSVRFNDNRPVQVPARSPLTPADPIADQAVRFQVSVADLVAAENQMGLIIKDLQIPQAGRMGPNRFYFRMKQEMLTLFTGRLFQIGEVKTTPPKTGSVEASTDRSVVVELVVK